MKKTYRLPELSFKEPLINTRNCSVGEDKRKVEANYLSRHSGRSEAESRNLEILVWMPDQIRHDRFEILV